MKITLEVERTLVHRAAGKADHVQIFVNTGYMPPPSNFTLEFACNQGNAEIYLAQLGIHSSDLIVGKADLATNLRNVAQRDLKPGKVTKLEDFKNRYKCRCDGPSHRPGCPFYVETL